MAGEAETPLPGAVIPVAPEVRRIIAPNPGPMTYWGTNTYLVGNDPVWIIDPGPDDDHHLEAILSAIGPSHIAGILVTHAHRDHTALVPRLAHATQAETFGFGAATAGRSAVMTRFAEAGGIGGGEGIDAAFAPDHQIADGHQLAAGPHCITALHTPGHFAGHLSFWMNDLLFSGDLVMDWSTTLISPPDGDVRDFFRSAGRIRALDAQILLPGHGKPVDAPRTRIDTLISHRFTREAQVISALATPAIPLDLAKSIYVDLPEALLPAAARNTLAHLLDLWERGIAQPIGTHPESAIWRHADKR